MFPIIAQDRPRACVQANQVQVADLLDGVPPSCLWWAYRVESDGRADDIQLREPEQSPALSRLTVKENRAQKHQRVLQADRPC
jgi:hypothetical protein